MTVSKDYGCFKCYKCYTLLRHLCVNFYSNGYFYSTNQLNKFRLNISKEGGEYWLTRQYESLDTYSLEEFILIEHNHLEAVSRKCSVKKVFLEISQNSQETTRARVAFLVKLQASGLGCFPVSMGVFL